MSTKKEKLKTLITKFIHVPENTLEALVDAIMDLDDPADDKAHREAKARHDESFRIMDKLSGQ